MTVSKARPARRSTTPHGAAKQDAVTMLEADHEKVAAMFERFATMKGDGVKKAALVAKICDELEIHMDIEERIFYPSMRAAIRDDALMDEAGVEHESFKTLIGQLRSLQPGEEQYAARVTVLGEYVKHHVKEEHGQMFPKARKTDVDLVALADAMRARRRELQDGDGRTQELFALTLAYPGMMV